jgi:hypothetical protein
MSGDKSIYVDEETYKIITEKLGYKPSNLFVNRFAPKNKAIVVDNKAFEKTLKKMQKELFEPRF